MKLWDKKKFRLLSYHLHLVSLRFCSFYSEFSFLSCRTFFGFQEHLLTLLKAQKWYSSIAALLCRWQHLKATKIPDLCSCSNDISSGWVRGKQGVGRVWEAARQVCQYNHHLCLCKDNIVLKIILFCKICVLSRSKSLHSMQIYMQITVEHLVLASKYSLQEKCTLYLSLRDHWFF